MRKKQKTKPMAFQIATQYYQRLVLSFHGISLSTLSYQNPLPSLPNINETSHDWSQRVTADNEQSVHCHIATALMSEPLSLVNLVPRFGYSVLTMSVTDISQRDSIGAVKKPWTARLAYHCPLVLICGAQSCVAFRGESVHAVPKFQNVTYYYTEEGDQVNRALAILKGQRLPEETTPSGKKKL
jgi:hypothetical protein